MVKDEFSKILEQGKVIASSKELDMILDRFDRDRDGRVTYSEFFTELAPKEN